MTLMDVPIVDIDSHVMEPPDLWTARAPAKQRELMPTVVWDDKRQENRWLIGGALDIPVALMAPAGWASPYPDHPPSSAEADPAAFDADKRLERLDDFGIWAQVLYPNLLAFSTPAFIDMGPELAGDCVRIYNDFLTEFASADPARLIPLTVLPFWDVDASVAEIERCTAAGHHGILFGAFFDQLGLPNIESDHWAPVLEAATSLDLSVNLHTGFNAARVALPFPAEAIDMFMCGQGDPTVFAEFTVPALLGNVRTICRLTMRGVCHRYPTLRFVSVESGAGYLPYLMQLMDWQFENTGAHRVHPEWSKPSEYFRRQVWGSFWFETLPAEVLVDLQDNLMFETDFPHPTCLVPGPGSVSLEPRQMLARCLDGVGDEVARKIVHDNAARVYGLA